MQAVEKDKDWNLEFNGKIYQTVKARYIFDLIALNAWKNGDPGLLFEDAVNNGPYKYSGQIIDATNPCVETGTLILTEHGWRKVEEVKIGDKLFCKGMLFPVEKIEKHEKYEIYKVEFSDGDTLHVTAAHRFKCVVGKQYKYLRLDEMEIGSQVLVEGFSWSDCPQEQIEMGFKYSSITQRDLGLIIGAVIGDGCYTEKSNYRTKISFGKKEIDWQNHFKSMLEKYEIKFSVEQDESTVRIASDDISEICRIVGLKPAKAIDKIIPENLLQTSNTEFLIGLIDGLFSTAGNMYLKKDNPMLRYISSNKELCKQIRYLLLGFGVHSRIYKKIRKPHVYNDPKYGPRNIKSTNPKFDVFIMNDGIINFNYKIKLSNKDKQNKIDSCIKNYHITGGSNKGTVKKIEKLDYLSDVYDLKCSYDEWNAQGYISQGCGEQPLPNYLLEENGHRTFGGGSCNLGSIDISKLYNNETKDINWNEFAQAIKCCIVFLDNVIDINQFPNKAFELWAKENRPVGLGIMGLADLFLKMKIQYGSDESIELSEKIAKFLEKTAHKKSVELAEKKGTPKSCKYKELENRRNVTLTSIAPTGTISLIACCSSSIEPIFSPTIYRYDNTGQYVIPHPDSDKKYFRCAIDKEENGKREVTWEQHIKIQSAWQKYGSSGISKTINLPNSATVEDVKNAYMLSWKSGNKGITVYRDGSKTTQVLNTSENNKNRLNSNHAVKRPDSVPADIFKQKADGYTWHIIIGKVDDCPYELFAVNGHVELPEKGVVRKNKSRNYSLLDADGNVLLENIIEQEQDLDPRISLETRRFSLELRHGIPIKYIVQQIDKSSAIITSFSKVVGRVFKQKYLSSEDLNSITSPCPYCAAKGIQTQMINESGCIKCPIPECGYSKCG